LLVGDHRCNFKRFYFTEKLSILEKPISQFKKRSRIAGILKSKSYQIAIIQLLSRVAIVLNLAKELKLMKRKVITTITIIFCMIFVVYLVPFCK